MQPLSRTIAHLEGRWQSLNILDNVFVEVRHAKLEAVRHGELVCIHEKFIWERRMHFQQLQPSKLISADQRIGEILPAIQDNVSRSAVQHAFMEKAIHSSARHN